MCASRRIGRPEKPPLTPIPISGPFDRVGVDVIQFPMSFDGNRYAVVFMDYLTKWPEVFAVPDQSPLTIAQLLMDHVITRHGVPAELLSDRGKAFLSDLMQEIYKLMGIHKVSTTAYHPQTDGLVERFNRTLTDMLAKTVEKSGWDWDQHLPRVLMAYCVSPQESTRERVPSISCMDVTHSYPQMQPCVCRNPDIQWTWMTTRQVWWKAFLKPGGWRRQKSRRHRTDRRSIMIVEPRSRSSR